MGRYVIMGVAGCGKSRIGAALAKQIGAAFVDGDSLHPPANVAKMSGGQPLNDEDRAPWIKRVAETLVETEGPVIVACSALKKAYRDQIRGIAGEVVFLFLDGSRDVLARRLETREGHFMPANLLDSQLATLQRPGPDEPAISVGIDQSPDAVVSVLANRIKGVLK
ncbi:MAG: gluconokinase [Planctomycetales bacterium]|nr:gluconokinase [Planctomycetales bacterium]MCC0025150.1 gluconokinase [Hyphomicrobiaceae bacterium]